MKAKLFLFLLLSTAALAQSSLTSEEQAALDRINAGIDGMAIVLKMNVQDVSNLMMKQRGIGNAIAADLQAQIDALKLQIAASGNSSNCNFWICEPVQASSSTPNATIAFSTSVAATCKVDYGSTSAWGTATAFDASSKNHSISFNGLPSAGATEHFKLTCKFTADSGKIQTVTRSDDTFKVQ